MQVIFEELGHNYYELVDNIKVQQGLSMTTFIGKFKQKYQEHFWSIYTAVRRELQIEDRKQFSALCKQHGFNFKRHDSFDTQEERVLFLKSCIGKLVDWNKVINNTSKEVKQDWQDKKDNACNVGTEFHEHKEEKAYEEKKAVIGNTEVSLALNNISQGSKEIRYSKDLTNLEDGYHPELLLYLSSIILEGSEYTIFLTGQADKVYVETINGVRYIDVDDYKTNEKIEESNFFNKMEFPINHLDDCNFIHYCLQISGYARILEEYGYVVRNLNFTHHDIKKLGMTKNIDVSLLGKEKVTVKKVPYLKEEFEDMIKFYFENNRKQLINKPNKEVKVKSKYNFE